MFSSRRPRWAAGPEVQIAYLVELLCLQIKDIGITRLGIHPSLRGKVILRSGSTKLLERSPKNMELAMKR